jgi:hypothetical protein
MCMCDVLNMPEPGDVKLCVNGAYLLAGGVDYGDGPTPQTALPLRLFNPVGVHLSTRVQSLRRSARLFAWEVRDQSCKGA